MADQKNQANNLSSYPETQQGSNHVTMPGVPPDAVLTKKYDLENGTMFLFDLNGEQSFAFQSTVSDVRAGVRPTDEVVETVTSHPVGSGRSLMPMLTGIPNPEPMSQQMRRGREHAGNMIEGARTVIGAVSDAASQELDRSLEVARAVKAELEVRPRQVAAAVISVLTLASAAGVIHEIGTNPEEPLSAQVHQEAQGALRAFPIERTANYVRISLPTTTPVSVEDIAKVTGLDHQSIMMDKGTLLLPGTTSNEQAMLAVIASGGLGNAIENTEKAQPLVESTTPSTVVETSSTSTTATPETTTSTLQPETTTTAPPTPEVPAPVEAPSPSKRDLTYLKLYLAAKSYVGITENPKTPNHGPEIDKYFQAGLTGSKAEWCASFISRIFADAGIPFTGGSKDGYKGPDWQLEFVNRVATWMRDNGAEVFDRDAILSHAMTPQPGDIVIFNRDGQAFDNQPGVNHIGLVTNFHPETGYIETIEGNSSNKVAERWHNVYSGINPNKKGRGANIAMILRHPDLKIIDTAPAVAPVAPEEPAPTPPPPPETPKEPTIEEVQTVYDTHMQGLLAEISHGEGGIDSVNTGHSGDTKVGSDAYRKIFGDKKLSELTIAQIMKLQAAGKIFAVGELQFIPSTLKSAVKVSGIDPNTSFDKATQEKLGVEYLIMSKRKPAADYITGKSDDLPAAVKALSQEWASLPGMNGKGYYDGDSAGNHAAGGIAKRDRVIGFLNSLREADAARKQTLIVASQPTIPATTVPETAPPTTAASTTSSTEAPTTTEVESTTSTSSSTIPEAPTTTADINTELADGIWLNADDAAPAFERFFVDDSGKVDKVALNGWMDSLQHNSEGKVLISVNNLPNVNKSKEA